ncbi:MAG TPA: hypothetical protein VHB21_27755 [Minicystis sp.]|nr:hypothetical protein [Minicystis sp.]
MGSLLFAAPACGGKVVVDHGGPGSGSGGSTGASVPGADVCHKAVEFIDACAHTTAGTTMIKECTGQVACEAECILQSTCGAFDGTDPQAGAKLSACAAACANGF